VNTPHDTFHWRRLWDSREGLKSILVSEDVLAESSGAIALRFAAEVPEINPCGADLC
jgi:hypothetical protein